MKKIAFLFVVVLLLPAILFAQKRPKNKMKFGKIPMEQFQINSTELDTTADAIILGDFHKYDVYLSSSVKVYRRIKILTKNGVDELSNIGIRLYSGPGTDGRLRSFKASVYHLEGNEIIETKHKNKNYHIEQDEYWKTYKISLPNVQVGSIIEYEYDLYTAMFGVPTYYPQGEYPVLWSELEVEYVNGINFKHFAQGNTNPFFYSDGYSPNQRVLETWVYKNVTPLKQEKFMPPVRNYLTQVDYEIENINLPGVTQNITTSWAEIKHDYIDHERRGELLEKKRFFKDLAEIVKSDTQLKTDMQKVHFLVDHIRTNYNCDGRERFIPSYNFNEVLKDKSGNSADLNFLFMGTLNILGIKTYPVLLSTKDHGLVLQSRPSLEALNYCISSFEINDQQYLIDLSTKYSSLNELPAKCFNGEAFMLKGKLGKWIEINPATKYEKNIFVMASFDDEMNITGVLQSKENGYAAQETRKEIIDQGSVLEYIANENKRLDFVKTENFTVSNESENDLPISQKFDFLIENEFESDDEYIHFSPILFQDFEKNPFQKDHREFIIDFGQPYDLKYTYIYTIPDHYLVDELPEPKQITNENKTLSYTYNINQNGNKISIVQNFKINKTSFFAQDYEEIKSFFDYFISHQNLPITLISKE